MLDDGRGGAGGSVPATLSLTVGNAATFGQFTPGIAKDYTASTTAKSLGVPCKTIHAEQGHPYEGIIKTATAQGCDLIVMASHGRRGLEGLLLGSETLKVLTHSKTPGLVSR